MVETRRSKILGPDGAPIQVPLLTGEIAAPERQGARALVYYSAASGLTPQGLVQIYEQANIGHARAYLTLATDMEERYLHYRSQLQTRRLALDGGTISVAAPKGANPKAVDFVESLVADPMFPDMVQALQGAVSCGYAVVEPVWEYQQGALRPVEYRRRDPRFFRYDEVSQERLCLLLDSGLPGEEIRAPYFIRHEPMLMAGPPVRRGLARSVGWAFVMQTFAQQDWAAFCEVYGIPFRVGKYHASATEKDKATLLRAVRAIANDAAAIIPESTVIEFQEVNGSRGEAVFGNFIDYLDRKVSLVVLGQTMTSEVSASGGSLAQAKVQENVRADITRADLRQTAATLNRDLIRMAVAMNFGPQEVYPAIEMELADNEDLTALATFLEKTIPLGLDIGQSFVRKKASIPEPDAQDRLLHAPDKAADVSSGDKTRAADVSSGDKTRAADVSSGEHAPRAGKDKKPGDDRVTLAALGGACPHCGEAHGARLAADDPTGVTALDDTDEIVDDALADWREIRDPLLAGLLAAASGATSFEDALARLSEAQIGSRPLVDALSRATAKARGLGDVRD